jgi:hypothetical protein
MGMPLLKETQGLIEQVAAYTAARAISPELTFTQSRQTLCSIGSIPLHTPSSAAVAGQHQAAAASSSSSKQQLLQQQASCSSHRTAPHQISARSARDAAPLTAALTCLR